MTQPQLHLGDLRIEVTSTEPSEALERWFNSFAGQRRCDQSIKIFHRHSEQLYRPDGGGHLALLERRVVAPDRLEVVTYRHPRVAQRWSVPQQQCVALLAAYAYASQKTDWRVLHGAGCASFLNQGLLVLGHSGAGKSTLVRRLGLEQLGDEVIRIGLTEQRAWLQGTPVPGELKADHLKTLGLEAMIVPGHKKGDAVLERLSLIEATHILLSAAIRLSDQEMGDDLSWTKRVLGVVPMYRLSWDPSKILDVQALISRIDPCSPGS